MTPAEAMEIIEGRDFSAEVNIASTLKTFLRVMTGHVAVKRLQDGLAHLDGVDVLLDRLFGLLEQKSEEGKESPNDSAIAAYLWPINGKDSERAESAASAILDCDHCWWAKKVAQTIVNGKGGQIPTQNDGVTEVSAHPRGA